MKVSIYMIENPVEGPCDYLHQKFSDSPRSKSKISSFLRDVLPYISGRISNALKQRYSYETGKELKGRSIHIKITY